jgi:hypothetical protein
VVDDVFLGTHELADFFGHDRPLWSQVRELWVCTSCAAELFPMGGLLVLRGMRVFKALQREGVCCPLRICAMGVGATLRWLVPVGMHQIDREINNHDLNCPVLSKSKSLFDLYSVPKSGRSLSTAGWRYRASQIPRHYLRSLIVS